MFRINPAYDSHCFKVSTLQMPLVMFLDACEHCARICLELKSRNLHNSGRVLSQPSGNVLLLGVGGSGRQSLTRLSTHMNATRSKHLEFRSGLDLSRISLNSSGDL